MITKNAVNIGIGLATGALLASGCATEKKAPNLVFIFSDQQTFDMLGCYGNQQIITPNLDRFATQGIRFTQCYSNSPICAPFRGMLLSGKHSIKNGCYVNDKPLIPGQGKKFAEVLRGAGYNTAYIGKWHLLGGNRDRPIPKGEMRYGFDELFLSNNCHVDFRADNCFYWNEAGEKVFFNEWEVYGQTRQALNYLDTRKESKNPFALFVSWHPPHDWGKFQGEDSLMHYKYDAPEELMAMYNRDSIRVRLGMKDSPDLRRMYHGQMAMTTGVDIAFGQLMEKLKQLGIEENTLVVFTSDHGDMLEFDHAVYPKQYPHDYSLHVPYMMRWPGKFTPNTTTGLLYSALDMMPSILGLLGLDVPKECDGKNLAKPILSGNENAVDYVPIWLYEGNGFRGVITRECTFATQEGATEGSLHSVLFDRVNDPYQLNNRFADPQFKSTREKMLALTYEWMKKYNDNFFTQEEMDRR